MKNGHNTSFILGAYKAHLKETHIGAQRSHRWNGSQSKMQS